MLNNSNKNTIRHCMVVHNSYPFAETRVQRQSEALVNLGYEVDVIGLRAGNEPLFEVVNGVNVHRLPMKRHKSGRFVQFFEYFTFLLAAFFKLSSLYFKRKYDTIQVHNLPDFLVFVALVPKLGGRKIILDIHDLMPEFYCAKFKSTMNSFPVRLIRWQEWLSCRFANHVITVTEAWRQTLIERGVSDEKSSVVMNIADSRHFNRKVEGSPPSDKFHIVYHGTITARYGIDLVLEAVAQLRTELPDLQLTIQGRGEYLSTVISLVKSLKLEDIVTVQSDFLAIEDLAKLIKSGHVGIVPYRSDIFTDGILPTKLMEYTALGVPAIAAYTTGIAAYFDDSMVEFFKSEDLADLKEHIRLLYNNRPRLTELVSQSDQFNQQYNWQKQATDYAKLIQKLAKNSH